MTTWEEFFNSPEGKASHQRMIEVRDEIRALREEMEREPVLNYILNNCGMLGDGLTDEEVIERL